jgi:RNA polymerase sigma-70 factor (ECF subfamily)
MVRSYRFWTSFKPGTSVRAWLFTILRNTFINRYHRSNRDRAHIGELSVQHEAFGDDNSPARPRRSCPPPRRSWPSAASASASRPHY